MKKLSLNHKNLTRNEKTVTIAILTMPLVAAEPGPCSFGFRAATTEKTYTTGLYYFNPDDGKVYNFNGTQDKILGVCINPRLTHLF